MTTNEFKLLAGPCVIESQDNVLLLADALKRIAEQHDIDFYFKASWDKANRTKATNYRGPGLEEGLRILEKAKNDVGVKIVTDIHEPHQAKPVAEVADILQIPAFLCRQTDLLRAAAETGKMVNIKKAQFSSPEEMGNVVSKMEHFGCRNFMLCERGNCFGYNNLVVDMTSLVRMREYGCPVIFDATHSVQQPSSQQGITGGNRELVPPLMRAALAVGIDGLFMEVHPDPDHAISDAANQVKLSDIRQILKQAKAFEALAHAEF